MSNIQHRLPGEGAARPEKENATAGDRGAADKAKQSEHHSTVEQAPAEADVSRERGLFLPLLWAQLGREAKAKPFKGKAKRYQGAVDSALVGLLALATVAGVLLLGGA